MASDLAVLLRSKRSKIVSRFVQERDASSAHADGPERMAGAVGVLLDELADALEAEAGTASERSWRARDAARELGHQRFSLGGDVATLLREHGRLRDIVFDLMVETSVTPTLDEARALSAHLAGAIGDAAERHGEERDLLLKAQSARHLGFLAHELRNPLSSVGIAFSLLKSKGVLHDDEPCVGAMGRGLRTVNQLIDDALVSASLEGGSGLQLQDLDVAELVGSLVQEAAPQAEHKHVQLMVACSAGPCRADYRYVHSALSNLIRNAVKFTRSGSVVQIAARGVGGRVIIDVEDECGGIATDDVDRLFDAFVQRGTDRTGFGLGLAIAKQAMAAHQGSLLVRTVPARGCVFTMNLPQRGPRAA